MASFLHFEVALLVYKAMNENIDILKELVEPFRSITGSLGDVSKNLSSASDAMKKAARDIVDSTKSMVGAIQGLAGVFGSRSLWQSMNRKPSGTISTNIPGYGPASLKPVIHSLSSLQQGYQTGTARLTMSFSQYMQDYVKILYGKGRGQYLNLPQSMGNWGQYLQAGYALNPKAFGGMKQAIGDSGGIKQVLESVLQGFPKIGVAFATLGALAAVLAVSFGLMVAAAKSWVSHMKENLTGLVSSGGRLGQFGQLHNAASMFGMTGGQFGAKARQFGDLLTQGGIPAGIAAQMGIKPYGGLGGDQNYLDKFITALKSVLSDPDFDRSSKKARYLGLEEFMWLRDADQKYKDMALNAMGEKTTPADRKAAANAQAEMFKLQKELNEAWNEFGRQVLPIVISGLKALTSALIFFVNNLHAIIGAISGALIGSLFGPIGMLVGGVAGGITGAGYSGWAKNNRGNSEETISANTQAVKANTNAIIDNTMMMNGTHGGGSRFNGRVIPAGWGPMQINDSARGTAMALGALQL